MHSLMIQRAAIDADAYRLVVIDRDLANGRELFVAPLAGADIARVNPVFIQRVGAFRVARQQQVAIVMKVADQRCRATGVEHATLDLGNCRRGFGQIHGDAHHLRARLPQLDALLRRGCRIRRVRHRHRLDDDRRAATNGDVADLHADGAMTFVYCEQLIFLPAV
jgi:hypothetical protein